MIDRFKYRITIVNLLKEKDKQLSQQNQVYSGMAQKWQFGTSTLWQMIGKYIERWRRASIYREKKEVGRGVLNKTPLEENESSLAAGKVVVAFPWLLS